MAWDSGAMKGVHVMKGRATGERVTVKKGERFGIVILGGGSAAFAAALKATESGADVAICEEHVIGGTCLNRGCIPSKSLLKASEVFYYSVRQPFQGIEVPKGKVDLARLIEQKDDLVHSLRQEKYLNILSGNKKIHYFRGTALFISENEVKVEDQTLFGERFIVATGATPQIIPFKGIEKVDFLNSTTALDLKELPSSMVIIGGRFVAVEMAQLFAHFGTRVTILQRSERIIPEEEEEISEGLKKYLEEEGIKVITGVKILELYKKGKRQVVKAEIDGGIREFEGERLLMATGITPNTKALNLEAAGVMVDGHGFIETDDYMRTSNHKIFAAGDVAGRMPLVTVAAVEGSVAAQNALNMDSPKSIDYSVIPHAIFTQPNVAVAGLTEKDAVTKGFSVISRTLDLRHVPKARAVWDTRGLIKIVAEQATGTIIGVHILAPEAAEVIHQAVLIVKNKMTLKDAAEKIDVYPTLSEMVKLCAQSFYKDIKKLSCCAD